MFVDKNMCEMKSKKNNSLNNFIINLVSKIFIRDESIFQNLDGKE